jgi:L-seryl-tRNA(Ser) seleniumtransferase
VKSASKSDLFRKLPSVDELMLRAELVQLVADAGRSAVLDATRSVLDRIRTEINNGNLDEQGADAMLGRLSGAVIRQLHDELNFSLRPVINATGVILHTNLGRAPLADEAIDRIRAVSVGYSNLEFDLADGKRGERDVHVDRLFQKLLGNKGDGTRDSETPVPSTIVVNNNAAAVWLALNTLAAGAEVIVSRGELVEIGGSFRIPDVMAQSNGILREVGTTNRTRIGDYAQAINDKTRLLLRVHRSNFEITGFTERPALEELVALSRERNLPLVEDLGSGALFEMQTLGISGEFGVADSLRAGVDVVTYSGDKLLGGPQAGMLTGRSDLIARMRTNSLFRALRVDKLTYAALEATLLAYVRQDHDAIPILRMLRLPKDEIARRSLAIAKNAQDAPELQIEVVDGESVIGGGAAPSALLHTSLLAVAMKERRADELLTRLRTGEPPVIARVAEGRVLLDLRTVFPEQDAAIVAALHAIAKQQV